MHAIDGETMGMEYENDSLPYEVLQNISTQFNWRFTHDASCESPALAINRNLTLTTDNRTSMRFLENFGCRTTRIGGEILSPVLTLEDFFLVIEPFLKKIDAAGSNLTSERSGIHFHESLLTTLARVKNILILGAKYEPVFFRLGGMGYRFRGEKNDSIYCRPITESGPPVVNTRRGRGQIFIIDDLLNAKSLDNFWYRYGDSQKFNRRYTQPARYSWLNLFSMNPNSDSYHGTLEFRVFNFSLNYRYIKAVAKLCQKFTQMVIKESFNDTLIREREVNSVFSTPESDVRKLFNELMGVLRMPNETGYILEKILNSTPPIELDPSFVFTHKSIDGTFFNGEGYCTPEVDGEVKNPTFVDIHSLE